MTTRESPQMENISEIAKRLEQSLRLQESSTPPPSSCEPECAECRDTGFVPGERGLRECSCALERRVLARLPLRYKSASLLDFPKATQDAMLDWLSNPGDGLLITGLVGTGKTHLLAALTRTLLLAGQEAIFLRCADLYRDLRDCYARNSPEESVLRDYLRHRWLFLDDLGAGSLSDFERRNTLELLDRRFNLRLPSAISTNWSLLEVAEKMDERIASRLSALHPVELSGEDKRSAPRTLATAHLEVR
jgi:DNA replication protein DnaC